jgi:small subunit ribosomal protein S9
MAEEIKSLDQLKDAVADQGFETPETETLVSREPVRDALNRSYATGKRKDAVARVWVKPGTGQVTVNGREMATYFARPVLQMVIGQPFKVANVAASST